MSFVNLCCNTVFFVLRPDRLTSTTCLCFTTATCSARTNSPTTPRKSSSCSSSRHSFWICSQAVDSNLLDLYIFCHEVVRQIVMWIEYCLWSFHELVTVVVTRLAYVVLLAACEMFFNFLKCQFCGIYEICDVKNNFCTVMF